MGEFRKRVVGPTMLPLVATAFTGALVFAFSRILLAVPKTGSTTLALLLAAEVLGIAAVLAAAAKIRASQKALLVLLGLGIMGGGGIAAGIGIRDIEKHGGGVTITAKDILFDQNTLTFQAEHETELTFVNNDAGIPHNVAIYTGDPLKDPDSTQLFIGDIFNGVATRVYAVPELEIGTYFFRCDVHPTTMIGDVIVNETGEPDPNPTTTPTTSPTATVSPTTSPTATATPTGDPAPTTVDMSADNLAFDTNAITLAANTEVTIEFTNDEADQHNVAINTAEDLRGDNVFAGTIFAGPNKTETYTFTAPAPGTYYFYCQVHPFMKGTATFK